MKPIFDDQPMPIPCPHCGHKINKTVAWFRDNDKLSCPDCYYIACLDTRRLKQELVKVDEAIDNFTAEFQRLSNR